MTPRDQAVAAREAARALQALSSHQRADLLRRMADALERDRGVILAANARDLEGAVVRVGGARDDGRSTLVFFMSPTCPMCEAVLPAVRSLARNEREWLDVILASDGDEAWQFIESGKVDLAILDFYMPNVDGGTVLDRVRSSADHSTMPVLVVSSEEDRKNVALAGGADRFLDKPLRLVDLAEEVRALLRIED